MRKLTDKDDWIIAAVLFFVGIGLIVLGIATHRAPLTMLPGMDGAVTACALGSLFLFLEGVPFRRALLAILPVVFVLIVLCPQHNVSTPAVVGLQAALFAMFGAVSMALRGDTPTTPEVEVPSVSESGDVAHGEADS